MKVIHWKKGEYDVYIGRGRCPKTGKKSKWGNPFTHISDRNTLADFVVESREVAISKYEEWIKTQPELMNSLHELKGKTLACWCKPKSCHGDILIKLVNGIHE